ncbi:MAG: protein-disulfide reductase DsbD, partial [Pontibacterium sp.]
HSITPAPAEQKDDPLFGQVWVYYQQADISVGLASVSDAAQSGTIKVTYQGCWEGGICYPPVTTTVDVINVEPASVVASTASNTSDSSLSASPFASPAQTYQSEQDAFAAKIADSNVFVMVGLFFVAGLALSFTPCVFPMIPILSSVIAGQGGATNVQRSFMLSLVYVCAVSITYTGAGVIAGLFGHNLQAALQTPWLIGLFTALFVVLALSMFGLFQLQIPSSWQTYLNNLSGKQSGGTFLGAGIMGFLSALIVGPCVAAPLAGALIYIGQTGDPVFGGVALFAMSLGMGVPLLVVGVSAGKFLPKAGTWMDTVKAGFGVLLLLMAIWMLDRVVSTATTMLLLSIVLMVTSVFMGALRFTSFETGGVAKLSQGVGLLLFIYGGALLVGVLSGNQSLLTPLKSNVSSVSSDSQPVSGVAFKKITTQAELDMLLSEAKQSGQPVMLDFYADWCVSCVELDHFTFSDPRVKAELSGFKTIKVDMTDYNDEAKALSKAYGVIGPPALIFYDQQGNQRRDLMRVGFIDVDEFITHLQRL